MSFHITVLSSRGCYNPQSIYRIIYVLIYRTAKNKEIIIGKYLYRAREVSGTSMQLHELAKFNRTVCD